MKKLDFELLEEDYSDRIITASHNGGYLMAIRERRECFKDIDALVEDECITNDEAYLIKETIKDALRFVLIGKE